MVILALLHDQQRGRCEGEKLHQNYDFDLLLAGAKPSFIHSTAFQVVGRYAVQVEGSFRFHPGLLSFALWLPG